MAKRAPAVAVTRVSHQSLARIGARDEGEALHRRHLLSWLLRAAGAIEAKPCQWRLGISAVIGGGDDLTRLGPATKFRRGLPR